MGKVLIKLVINIRALLLLHPSMEWGGAKFCCVCYRNWRRHVSLWSRHCCHQARKGRGSLFPEKYFRQALWCSRGCYTPGLCTQSSEILSPWEVGPPITLDRDRGGWELAGHRSSLKLSHFQWKYTCILLCCVRWGFGNSFKDSGCQTLKFLGVTWSVRRNTNCWALP